MADKKKRKLFPTEGYVKRESLIKEPVERNSDGTVKRDPNNLLANSITTVATCNQNDFPDSKNTNRTLAIFPDLHSKLVEKNYFVELKTGHKKRPSERLMYVLDEEITNNNGKDEEMIAIIKIIKYEQCEAALGDGIAFLLNGGPHDGNHGNNTHIVFTYKGSTKEIFQKEGPNKEFGGSKGGKFDGGQQGIPMPNFNLGDLAELGYVGYKVQSIKKSGRSREYIGFVDRNVNQQTKQFSGQWEEWLKVHDKGKFKNKNSHPIEVNNRTWHNWIRMDGAKAEIVFFSVTHS
jgi:hypothetical protein